MPRSTHAVERMVTAACAHGYTRAQALQAIVLACDEVLTRYAGSTSINLPYMRALRGEAMRKWRATPQETSTRMRAGSAKRGSAE